MRNGFKTLLESVQKQCPELITEEIFSDMMTKFDDGVAKLQADATDEGQAIGFREGYEEGKRVAAEQAKAELETLTEKLDAEAVQKLTNILQMIDENHTAKLQELYDFMQTNMVPKTDLDAALAAQDEDYANKFESAMDAVCDDHACKLQTFKEAIEAKHAAEVKVIKEDIDKKYQELLTEAVKTIDEENTSKLKEVVKLLNENKEQALKTLEESIKADADKKLQETTVLYESKLADADAKLKAEQKRKLNILAEGVEKYLNYALEQYMPKQKLISEAKYNAAIKTLDKVTDLLKVNTIIQESKDGIFAEFTEKLEAAKAKQNELINEKIELKAQLNKKEAQLLLEEKTRKCTPGEARFLRGYFKDANSPKVIEESMEAAHTAWKKIVSEHRQQLQESVKPEVSNTPSKVVTEAVKEEPVKTQVISEEKAGDKTEQAQSVDLAAFYAQYLK